MTTTDRWGIAGDDWRNVRHVVRGEEEARKWAASLSTGKRAEAITLYRDTGNGWTVVERFAAEAVSS